MYAYNIIGIGGLLFATGTNTTMLVEMLRPVCIELFIDLLQEPHSSTRYDS